MSATTYQPEGSRPIHVWTEDIEPGAREQLENMARMPFLHPHGVAAMADTHQGIGATVGSVIATAGAIIPAAVGVDIGCGMNAVRTSLRAKDLPDSLGSLRHDIERGIPLGPGGAHSNTLTVDGAYKQLRFMKGEDALHGERVTIVDPIFKGNTEKFYQKAGSQLGTLGSGNHFIELCLDEDDAVWVMLHSGSRGIGNMIGQHYIERARKLMEQYFITLPDRDLAYLPEDTDDFRLYIEAVHWAQNYAFENRKQMMHTVLRALQYSLAPRLFTLTTEAVNCHHNYVEMENHYGKNVWVTRKGAIRARTDDLGIIPGSMGTRSYIVRGKGNPASYHSCSHGAGRRMSRGVARKTFTLNDLAAQTAGVECRKDASILDEIPGAYKDIDVVMANQQDLVEIVHTLRAVLCIKGA